MHSYIHWQISLAVYGCEMEGTRRKVLRKIVHVINDTYVKMWLIFNIIKVSTRYSSVQTLC